MIVYHSYDRTVSITMVTKITFSRFFFVLFFDHMSIQWFTRVPVATEALPKAQNGEIPCARDKKRRGPKGQVATETLVLVSAIHV